MNENVVKSKVLGEIMKLMDEKDGEKLKMHPKLVAMKVTTATPVEKIKLGSAADKADDLAENEPKDVEDLESKVGSDISEEIDPELLAELIKNFKK